MASNRYATATDSSFASATASLALDDGDDLGQCIGDDDGWDQQDDEFEDDQQEEEDEEEEEELLVIQEAEASQRSSRTGERHVGEGKPYQQPGSKAVYSVRGTSLTYAEAKLFGLVDENGQLIIPSVEQDHQHNLKGLDFIRKLNKKSEISVFFLAACIPPL